MCLYLLYRMIFLLYNHYYKKATQIFEILLNMFAAKYTHPVGSVQTCHSNANTNILIHGIEMHNKHMNL